MSGITNIPVASAKTVALACEDAYRRGFTRAWWMAYGFGILIGGLTVIAIQWILS